MNACTDAHMITSVPLPCPDSMARAQAPVVGGDPQVGAEGGAHLDFLQGGPTGTFEEGLVHMRFT